MSKLKVPTEPCSLKVSKRGSFLASSGRWWVQVFLACGHITPVLPLFHMPSLFLLLLLFLRRAVVTGFGRPTQVIVDFPGDSDGEDLPARLDTWV